MKRSLGERVPLWVVIALAMAAPASALVAYWHLNDVPLVRPARPVELTQEGAEIATTEPEAVAPGP